MAITENYILGGVAKDLTLTLMTAGRVLHTEVDRLIVRLRNGAPNGQPSDVEIRFDPDKLQAKVETIRIEDEELGAEWGSDLQRILLVAIDHLQEGTLTVSFRRSSK